MTNQLTTEQAAIHVGLSASMMAKMRIVGTGPKFDKLGRSVRYNRAELDNWLESCRRNNTSEH